MFLLFYCRAYIVVFWLSKLAAVQYYVYIVMHLELSAAVFVCLVNSVCVCMCARVYVCVCVLQHAVCLISFPSPHTCAVTFLTTTECKSIYL